MSFMRIVYPGKKCHWIFFFFYTSCLVNFFYFLFLRGADDLLPILAFVALRSEMPQLVSECAELEEFIHEG